MDIKDKNTTDVFKFSAHADMLISQVRFLCGKWETTKYTFRRQELETQVFQPFSTRFRFS